MNACVALVQHAPQRLWGHVHNEAALAIPRFNGLYDITARRQLDTVWRDVSDLVMQSVQYENGWPTVVVQRFFVTRWQCYLQHPKFVASLGPVDETPSTDSVRNRHLVLRMQATGKSRLQDAQRVGRPRAIRCKCCVCSVRIMPVAWRGRIMTVLVVEECFVSRVLHRFSE